MISKEICIALILDQFPGFQSRWQEHQDYWNGTEAGLCNDIAEFSHYVIDLINHRLLADLPAVFGLAEQFITKGDDEVRTAFATCFLENLLAASSAGKIDADEFVHLLGPRSRAYCKAWDEFTGVQTRSL